MSKVILRKTTRERRIVKINGTLIGTAERPRLSVFRSNKYIYAQLIDDKSGKVLVDVSAEVKKIHEKKTKVEAAKEVGKHLAEKAKSKKIKDVVFDRRGYRYHGRVKSLADGAREGGLNL
ncbi:50S ribosomal protein L18 [candidate division WWE3 bacterium RIFOXYC1_FULL_39_7]|uniref:Large ribosomal subunit protein uL18 n=2 Tax=Katanobacteria TaxID=422282 RepID=A0A1F4X436_UNCKA|nr:MAG: 50S ribosomal protein L18 [candidate division WWE3 bacterium RIFOXYC1_FULL_39_7]OGC76484.1 MAG: 50S ribosomal protein L18 [candidate division WWE3 bacterium RIFOXYD1_FULL_39_9]